MLIEHILYNLSIAIIIGILYNRYTNRNPTWIIVITSWLPDIDYVVQSLWYNIYQCTAILCPIMIRHGDFHNIMVIILLSIIFGYLIYKYCNVLLKDAILCVGIGCIAHLVEDITVYDKTYRLLYPMSNIQFYNLNLINESRNILGIGDSNIIAIGIFILLCFCIIKFMVDGMGCVEYMENVYNEYTEKVVKYSNIFYNQCVAILVNLYLR
jgi:membrane-bound metal-dependent hydrolase YbcI (DUF457 family)